MRRLCRIDEPWPNTRNGGPPKYDTPLVMLRLRRLGNSVIDDGLPADLNVITADGTGKAALQ